VKELLVLLAKLVLALIVNPAIDIDINPSDMISLINSKSVEYVRLARDSLTTSTPKKDEKSETARPIGNVVKYNIQGVKNVISQSQRMYSNVALIVNSLLLMPNDNDIMRYCLSILVTLFKLFIEFRENLRVPLLSVLSNIVKI
jgi:hypothetical protein